MADEFFQRSRRRLVWIAAAAAVLLCAAVVAGVFALSGGGSRPIRPFYRGPSTLTPNDTISIISSMHGPELPYIEKRGEIRAGDTFGASLGRLGFSPAFMEDVQTLISGVFSFNRCRPGDFFTVRTDPQGNLLKFAYQASPIDVYVVERTDDGKFEAYKEEFEEEMRLETVVGRIDSSLYEAVTAMGEDPELAMKIANEVFAWDIDFYTEAQKGDVFKLVVEKYYSGNYFIKYGRIMAAEYAGEIGKKQAFSWRDPTGQYGYYNALGVATRRVFLRSPLKYAHVTSRFGMRFHPILGTHKMHRGVDYGAAMGTPVWAVADGVCESAGWNGGLGNAVKIRHSSGYESVYGHMSRITQGLRAGGRVRQGTVIGNVGSTGLSTGPHLHFSLLQGGKFINPLKKVAPPTEPIPAAYLAAFKEAIKPWIVRLAEIRQGATQ